MPLDATMVHSINDRVGGFKTSAQCSIPQIKTKGYDHAIIFRVILYLRDYAKNEGKKMLSLFSVKKKVNFCLFTLPMSPCALCVESLKGGQTLQASSIGLQIVQTICKQCILIVHNLYNSTHNQNKLQVGKYCTACYLTEITFVQCNLKQTIFSLSVLSPHFLFCILTSAFFSILQ